MGCGASPRRLTATQRGARGWCKPRSALPVGSRLNVPTSTARGTARPQKPGFFEKPGFSFDPYSIFKNAVPEDV